jgi:hypothetical protein
MIADHENATFKLFQDQPLDLNPREISVDPR